ncbi:MAG: hypothetical protein KF847_08395 [Pirellulales bacterium]|nr:hypothetical protein [Pirellulales bacterium]
MSAMNHATLLVAQIDRFMRLGDGVRSNQYKDSSALVWFVVIAAAVGLGAMLFLQIRNRNDMSMRCDDPEKLFRELSLVHRLASRSQRTLRQVAETSSLPNVAQAFLTPGAFDVAAARADAQTEAEINELRARLL